MKHKHKDQYNSRTVDEVVELIREQIQSHTSQLTADTLDSIQEEGNEISKQTKEILKEVGQLSERDSSYRLRQKLKACSNELQRQKSLTEKLQWLGSNRVKFVLHLSTAWMLVENKQHPYATQLVSLLLFLHTNGQGLLQQVKTGEGKTLIVGFLAAAKALLGYKVDVVSSNRDLAEEGVEKCKKFFEALRLQAAVNCTDDDATNQQAYHSEIVYGDVGSFQRDVLTYETDEGSRYFKERYSDMTKACLIVDEVDSMFLDKGRHMLYLSHESPALKHLESLFLVIWSSVLSITPEQRSEQAMIDALLDQTATDLIKLIETKRISVPSYLTDFCSHKMRFWVRSAYQARFMDANDQFVIGRKTKHDGDESKDNGDKTEKIFPVDKQTGVEEYNMKWSNGLSQFLELKFRHKLSTESLKAIFISNKRFFKRYSTSLYGLTGTLGSSSSRKLLQEVYKVGTVELPTNKAKRFVQHKSHVATNDHGWCQVIFKEITDRKTKQPILVICENIKRLQLLEKHLTLLGDKSLKIIHYARDGDDVEKRFRKEGGASPSEIVLATNKGGRGTDIKIDEQKVSKGLHVIVAFLPENTRIEEQAFGRAARAGQAGSGCLTIQIDPDEYQSDIESFGSAEAATEVLIEKEKIKRDQMESDRISILLRDGIPQLDLEEGLYQLFQQKKQIFISTLKRSNSMFSDTMEACIEVFTDHWAYWLDSVTHHIQAADSSQKRKDLEQRFDKVFTSLSQTIPSFDSECTLFKMPEHCIKVGQAFLKREKPEKAQICFEMAMKRGDCTGLASMAACYCHIKENPSATKENKKKARHYLKIAQFNLNALRRSWMANGEIGKSLVDLIDVSEYVNTEENHYAEQVEDKLKVVGLHLNTLEILLGSTVDESSFISESKISAQESKCIYDMLVDHQVLHHYKVRKLWRDQKAVEAVFGDEVEPRIAKKLIPFIAKKAQSRGSISKHDLKEFVYGSDELWKLLDPLLATTEPVAILELSDIDTKLQEESLKQSWEQLIADFGDQLNSSTTLVLCHHDPLYLELQRHQRFTAHLRTNAFYRDTTRAAIKFDVLQRSGDIDLQQYEHCSVKDENDNDQKLRDFLNELLRYCYEHEGGYCYEYMLPFDSKEIEAGKLHSFLHEKDILKSGGLTADYHDNTEKLKSSVESVLTCYSQEQQAVVLNILQGLPGEIHRFERGMQIDFVDFFDLEDHPDDPPETIDFFTTWHLDQFLSLKQEEKGWWDWNAFAVAMIGLAQVIAGAALIALTAGAGSQIGSALISEGINDMVYATIAGITGTFSWKDWAIQKAISVAISIATGGISSLASLGKAAVKVGSASRLYIFAKTMLKAAGDFITNAAVSIISDVVLAEVQERVVDAIVETIETSLFSHLDTVLRARLVEIACTESSKHDFDKSCKDVQQKVRKALKKSALLPDAFDSLRTQVASSLQQNYKAIAESLSKSDSKWAKLASTGAKAALMADKVYTAVNAGINIWEAVDALMEIIPKSKHQASGQGLSLSSEYEAAIDQHCAEIKKEFEKFIQEHIRKKLKGILERIIKGSMKAVAKASKKAVSNVVKRTFHGKTTAEVVKGLHDKKTVRTTMADYDDDSHQHSVTDRTSEPKASTHAEKKQRAYEEKREKLQSTVLKPEDKDRQRDGTNEKSQKKVPGHDSQSARNTGSDKERRSLGKLSSDELHKVRGALQNTNSMLASTGTHRADYKATGYYSDRAKSEPLERMPTRERAKSAVHLSMPKSYHEQFGDKPGPPRRNTNVVKSEPFETKPAGVPGDA